MPPQTTGRPWSQQPAAFESTASLGPPLSRGEFLEAVLSIEPRTAAGAAIPLAKQGWDCLGESSLIALLPPWAAGPPPSLRSSAAAAVATVRADWAAAGGVYQSHPDITDQEIREGVEGLYYSLLTLLI